MDAAQRVQPDSVTAGIVQSQKMGGAHAVVVSLGHSAGGRSFKLRPDRAQDHETVLLETTSPNR